MALIDDLKEQFADILISYQRGEIDLVEALTMVRGMDESDPEPEEPELPEDDPEDSHAEPEEEPTLELEPTVEENPDAVDPSALAAAAADLDAALALVRK